MVSQTTLRELALSLPDVTEEPHFEKTSFRVRKKIFATMDDKSTRATVKLTEMDQDLFSSIDRTVICPVPNKWGKQGWTHVELSKIQDELLAEVLLAAYCTVAPRKLAESVRPDHGNSLKE